jgi:hypothetical protein
VYSKLSAGEQIRQGDIFRWLPKVELLLGEASLPMVIEPKEEGGRMIDWCKFVLTSKTLTTFASVRSVYGIVISQDCDASHCMNLTFAEIKPFKEINGFREMAEPPNPNSVIKIVTEHARKNQKWYFLSESDDLGFNRKMGVDFESLFEVNREMLVKNIDLLRLGRLDDEVAWPHFRERVAEFFRRYPYNEWYPLNSEEASIYEDKQQKSDPNFKLDPRYRWQNPS